MPQAKPDFEVISARGPVLSLCSFRNTKEAVAVAGAVGVLACKAAVVLLPGRLPAREPGQTDRQAGRQTDKQTKRQTDKQTANRNFDKLRVN